MEPEQKQPQNPTEKPTSDAGLTDLEELIAGATYVDESADDKARPVTYEDNPGAPSEDPDDEEDDEDGSDDPIEAINTLTAQLADLDYRTEEYHTVATELKDVLDEVIPNVTDPETKEVLETSREEIETFLNIIWDTEPGTEEEIMDPTEDTLHLLTHMVAAAGYEDGECLPCQQRAANPPRPNDQSYAPVTAVIDDATAEAGSEEMVDNGPVQYWKGIVGVEGQPTGDGRLIQKDSLTWGDLPIPIRYVSQDIGAHDGAQVVGVITALGREAATGNIIGWGEFDNGSEVGREAARLVGKKVVNGVSMDLDNVAFEVMDIDGNSFTVTSSARIRAVTIVAIPAFAEARIDVVSEEEYAARPQGAEGAMDTAPATETVDTETAIENEQDGANDDAQQLASDMLDEDVFLAMLVAYGRATESDDEPTDTPDTYNWVEKVGGLPRYIKRISKHLRKKGMTQGHAIAVAVNVVKKMCATGDLNYPGKQSANPISRAQACKAVAEWEAKKARAKLMKKAGETNTMADGTDTYAFDITQWRVPKGHGRLSGRWIDMPNKLFSDFRRDGFLNGRPTLFSEYLTTEEKDDSWAKMGQYLKHFDELNPGSSEWLSNLDKTISEADKSGSELSMLRGAMEDHPNINPADMEELKVLEDRFNTFVDKLNMIDASNFTEDDFEVDKDRINNNFDDLEDLADGGAEIIDIEADNDPDSFLGDRNIQQQVNIWHDKWSAEYAAYEKDLAEMGPVVVQFFGNLTSLLTEIQTRPSSAALQALVSTSATIRGYLEAIAQPGFLSQKTEDIVLKGYLPSLSELENETNDLINMLSRNGFSLTQAGPVQRMKGKNNTMATKRVRVVREQKTSPKTDTYGFNPDQWRNPRNGQWIDMPHTALKRLMRNVPKLNHKEDLSQSLDKLENVEAGSAEYLHSAENVENTVRRELRDNLGRVDAGELADIDETGELTHTIEVIQDYMEADAAGLLDKSFDIDNGFPEDDDFGPSMISKYDLPEENAALDYVQRAVGDDAAANTLEDILDRSRLSDKQKAMYIRWWLEEWGDELPSAKVIENLLNALGGYASGATAYHAPALTASAVKALSDKRPTKDMFANPHLTEPTPLTVTEDGRVYGHLAAWNTCHISQPEGPGTCTLAPRNHSGYAYFHVGSVICEDGTEVPVGRITLDTGHADGHLDATKTLAHYDNTGYAVADVQAGDDEHGIWVAGRIRGGVTPRKIEELRASPLSGDWRRINGNLELVAALAVNVPGFPIPRPKGLVASGHMTSLVASGIVAQAAAVQKVKKAAADNEYGLTQDDVKFVRNLANRERANNFAQRVKPARDRKKEDAMARINNMANKIKTDRKED